MNRVLFVSAEHASPDARSAVRGGAGRWQVAFASGALEAFAALDEDVCEVVIAHVSPDQAEGLDVLARVKTQYPEAARIALAAQLGPDLLPRALEVAHQCVPAPCEPEALWKVVDRTCFLNGLMRDRAIRALLGGLDRLPSVPRSYVALTQAMAREEVRLGDVASIVEQDTAMATKLLQLVNSAFFSRPRRITSIPVAVSLVGLERLKALALATHVFGMLSEAESKACGLDRLQERSLLTAHLARRFHADTRYADEAFTVGLLQDVGRMVLAVCLEDRYREVVDQARRRQRPVEVVEREVFGVSHSVVGACMLTVWGLPVSIVEAVAFRHAPSGVLHGDTALVEAVHVADAVAEVIEKGREPAPGALVLDPLLMLRPGMTDKVKRWFDVAMKEYAAVTG